MVIASGPFIINLNELRSLAHKIALEVRSAELLSGLFSQHYFLRIHVGQRTHLDLGCVKVMLTTILSLEFIVFIIVNTNAAFGAKVAGFLPFIHHRLSLYLLLNTLRTLHLLFRGA